MGIAIDLTDELLAQLSDLATALGVRVEELARAAVIDLITKPASDFREVAERVLHKNAELYRRFS